MANHCRPGDSSSPSMQDHLCALGQMNAPGRAHGRQRSAARRALAELLAHAAAGKFPAPDGSVDILPQPSDRDAGVISMAGYAMIFADADPAWIAEQLPPGDLS